MTQPRPPAPAPTAERVIARLGLQPHPTEGGYFRETYRAPDGPPDGTHCFSTAIYYLLTPDTVSAMHRLAHDEVFHHYAGDPVEQLHLRPDGGTARVILGTDLEAGHHPQVVVPRGVWQGARLVTGGDWALLAGESHLAEGSGKGGRSGFYRGLPCSEWEAPCPGFWTRFPTSAILGRPMPAMIFLMF